ncbi:hypothetical protein [Pseudomonas viridiflava]|uniref:hypothetical protein n=1 Tax=Pseudomonas viridiflava TaxID=33069 RepID=UPI000F01A159|nr:hypothetical protein [Pseudomonas viridiflava]
MATNREIELEQAAVAIVAEAKAQGLDLHRLSESAKLGIYANKRYCWISPDNKHGAAEAVDQILARCN